MNSVESQPIIIGGMFGLPRMSELHAGCTPPFMTERSLLVVNASSAVFILTGVLSPAQVWLPSYLCPSLVRAVEGHATEIRFYEMSYDLAVPSLDWLAEVRPGDLVILIDYFGHPCDPACMTGAKECGAWVLEDACQALLSRRTGRSADFLLFSPRKFLGVPDGGILTPVSELDLDGVSLMPPPADWWLKALSATVLRSEFDTHGGDRPWLELFRAVESEQPLGCYAIGELSRMLLVHAFDYRAIAQRRIANYELLAAKLGQMALYPTLASEMVPLGFPIRVRRRDQVRRALFKHDIYPPIHWTIQGVVPDRFEDSHRLSAQIMTLPCDQRYGSQEMDRIARLVLQEAER